MVRTSTITRMQGLRNRMSSLVECCLLEFEPINPPFTKEDAEMKLSICGVRSLKECFVTHQTTGVGKGDHLFEIKGYKEHTGLNGVSNSKWNTLPVCGAVNPTYKRVTLQNGTKKNIGRDFLTATEAQLLKPSDQRIYGVLRTWIAYCKSRGAVLSYLLSTSDEAFITAEKARFCNYLDGADQRLGAVSKKVDFLLA